MSKPVAEILATALQQLGWRTRISGAGLGSQRFQVIVTDRSTSGARLPS